MPLKNTERDFSRRSYFHVYNRAVDGQRVFERRADRERFLRLVALHFGRSSAEPFSYSLMPTHYHLGVFLETDESAISTAMQALLPNFSYHFNRARGRTGPLWDGPYRCRELENGADVANHIAYLHLNPGTAEVGDDSSHGAYLNSGLSPRWLHPARGLTVFGGRTGYLEFVRDTARVRAARSAASQLLDV